jgi:hypothetical protein
MGFAMPLLADVWKSGPLTVLGIGAFVLAVPAIFPALRPQWAKAVKAGVTFFLEAEFESDNAIVDQLVDAAIDSLLAATASGTETERKQAAERELHRFRHKARRRASRKAWDDADRDARYARYMEKLDLRMHRARKRRNGAHGAALDHAKATLAKHRTWS